MLCKLVCGKKKVNIQAFLIESDREYDMIKRQEDICDTRKAGGTPAEKREIYVKKRDCFICLLR